MKGRQHELPERVKSVGRGLSVERIPSEGGALCNRQVQKRVGADEIEDSLRPRAEESVERRDGYQQRGARRHQPRRSCPRHHRASLAAVACARICFARIIIRSFLQNPTQATPKRATQNEGHAREITVGDQIKRREANHQAEPRQKTPIGCTRRVFQPSHEGDEWEQEQTKSPDEADDPMIAESDDPCSVTYRHRRLLAGPALVDASPAITPPSEPRALQSPIEQARFVLEAKRHRAGSFASVCRPRPMPGEPRRG